MTEYTHKFHKNVFSEFHQVDVLSNFEMEMKTRKNPEITFPKCDIAFVFEEETIGILSHRDDYCFLNDEGLKLAEEKGYLGFVFDLKEPIKQAKPVKTYGDFYLDGSPAWDDKRLDVKTWKHLLKKYDNDKTLQEMIDKDIVILPLSFVSNDPFVALERINIDPSLFKTMKYDCPFIDGNSFYSALPVAAFIKPEYKDDILAIQGRKLNFYHKDMINMKNIKDSFFVGSAHPEALRSRSDHVFRLGHGYTDCTLPSDGSTDTELMLIEYEHAYLLVDVRFWYNQ